MMKLLASLVVIAIVGINANPVPQDGKVGADITRNHGQNPNLNLYGSHTFQGDRGQLGLSGNHQRELGGMNRHQTNAAVGGSYDVFRSNDGRTRGSVFGSANQQWNSHGSNSRGYEYGGRVEHTWGRK